jgi:hypothetical protein
MEAAVLAAFWGFGGRPRLLALVIGSRWLRSRLVDVSLWFWMISWNQGYVASAIVAPAVLMERPAQGVAPMADPLLPGICDGMLAQPFR